MIGIVIWALLIIFIVICVDGWAFIGMLLFCGAACIALYVLLCWIKTPLKSYPRRRNNTTYPDEKIKDQEREKAIDEWENKWNRKHPSRK